MWSFIDPSIYENPQPDPDTIHREMLRHERDVKGVPITHPLDQQLLNPQPYFVRGETDHHWLYLEGETTIEMDHVISQMLNNIGQDPLTKEAFKEAVDPLYHGHLERVIEENRLQEKVEENPRLTKEELRAQINQFARDFVYFGKEQEITDDRSFKSLGELFIRRRIYSFKDLPEEWVNDLKNNDLESTQKTKELFFKIIDDPITSEIIYKQRRH